MEINFKHLAAKRQGAMTYTPWSEEAQRQIRDFLAFMESATLRGVPRGFQAERALAYWGAEAGRLLMLSLDSKPSLRMPTEAELRERRRLKGMEGLPVPKFGAGTDERGKEMG